MRDHKLIEQLVANSYPTIAHELATLRARLAEVEGYAVRRVAELDALRAEVKAARRQYADYRANVTQEEIEPLLALLAAQEARAQRLEAVVREVCDAAEGVELPFRCGLWKALDEARAALSGKGDK
jgi:hypothetical protein